MFNTLARFSRTATPSTKRFKLYTAATPNGHQASVMLEELKALYGPEMEYEVEKLDLFGQDRQPQKESWFLAMNPNGRIPALTDRSRRDFHVFETAAILLYLAQHYDIGNRLSFNPNTARNEYSQMLQWIFFAHASIAPMQGQAYHFRSSAPEQIPYAIARYQDEVERVYGVLDSHLADRDWLAGVGHGRYSLADIKAFPWVRRHPGIGIDTLDKWPNVKAWLARAEARPAAKAGLEVPN
ncbi:glutathione S-transferase [Macrolepiota fuliginosa MF-IS2]|uniref:Glutathione S-transferase n=1 Tax=Macrolepiota fuliginosa MF-IS2 TaxID=1400762 RepID=A0A9P5XHX2_9AGAR|nr:glutathione S-transferase [Macrolepiota fuliginosa MF-IS2]